MVSVLTAKHISNARVRNLEDDADESICKVEIKMQAKRMGMWTQGRKGTVGQIERVALTYIHCHV